MTIDKLMKLYCYCYVAYKNMSHLRNQGLDEQHINEITEEIIKLEEKEINRYVIIDKNTLTQMTVEEFYSEFDTNLYTEDIDCDKCKYETCISCVSDLMNNLYNYDDAFREDFDKRYKIVKKL